MSNAFYWFNSKHGPEEGALVLLDRSLVRLNFRDYRDRGKAAEHLAGSAGLVTRSPRDGYWSGSARSEYLGREISVGYGMAIASAEEAADALLAKVAQEEEGERKVRANPEAYLERELARHDWYSAYSDNYSVSRAGDLHWGLVRSLMNEVPVETARALFAKHAPNVDLTCPV